MKRFHLNLNLNAIILLVAIGVLLPVMASTAVGIMAIIFAKDAGGIVIGVLVISFAVAAIGSAIIATVLTGRKAQLARRQADFVANVSHEFRTPLSAIRLYTQTLQSGKLAHDPEQAAACLATILRETAWLDTMVERVLAWRAASKDMLPLHLQSRPVAPAVADAVERFRAMVPPDALTLESEINTSMDVTHDADALNAVILNLLINAYKYTGDDKQIALRARDDAQGVIITVTDNGIGISPRATKQIFKPFYRVDERGSGVGLGLAIAHHMITQHHGTLTVDSTENQGSTFTIHLPPAPVPS